MDEARENQSKSTRSTRESNEDALQPLGPSSSQHETERRSPSHSSLEYDRTLTSPTSTSWDANCSSTSYQANGALMLNSSQSSYEQRNQLRQPEQSNPNSSRAITCPMLLCRPTWEETHNSSICQTRLSNISSQSNEHCNYLRQSLHANTHSNEAIDTPTLLFCPSSEVTPNSTNYQSTGCVVRNSDSSYQTQFEHGNANPQFNRATQLHYSSHADSSSKRNNSSDLEHPQRNNPRSPSKKRPSKRHRASGKSKRRDLSPKYGNNSPSSSHGKVRQPKNHYNKQNLTSCGRSSRRNKFSEDASSRDLNSWHNTARTQSTRYMEFASGEDTSECGLQSTCIRNHENGENVTSHGSPIHNTSNTVLAETISSRPLERLPNVEAQQHLQISESSQPPSDCISQIEGNLSHRSGQRYVISHRRRVCRHRQTRNNDVDDHLPTQNVITSTRHLTYNSINCQNRERLMSESTFPLQIHNSQNTVGHSSSHADSSSKRNNSSDLEHPQRNNPRSPSKKRPSKRHRASRKSKKRDLSPKDGNNSPSCSHGKVRQPKNHYNKQNSTRCGRSSRRNKFPDDTSRDLNSWHNTARTQSTRYMEFASAEDTPECGQQSRQSICNRNHENVENILSPRSPTHTTPNAVLAETILSRPLECLPNVENQQHLHISESSQLPSDCISQIEGNLSHRSGQRYINSHRLTISQHLQTTIDNVDEQLPTQNVIREPYRVEESSDTRPEDTVGSQLLYQAFILNNIFNNCNRRPAHPTELLDVRHELLRRNLTTPVIQPLDYLVRRCGLLDLQWQSPSSTTDLIKRFHALLDETLLPDPLYLDPSLRLCSRFFDCLYRPFYVCLGRTCSKISKALKIFSERVPGRPSDESKSHHTVDDGITFNPCSPAYSPTNVQAFLEGRFEALFSYYRTPQVPRINRELQERSEALFREFRRLNSIGMHDRISYNPPSPSYEPREARVSMEDHSEQPTEQDYTCELVSSNPNTVEETHFDRGFQEQSEAMFREFPRQNSASPDMRRRNSDIQHVTEFEHPRDMPSSETPKEQNRSSVVSMSNELDPPRNRSPVQPSCSAQLGLVEQSQDVILQNSSAPFIRINGNTMEISLPNPLENSNKSKRRVKEQAANKSSVNKNGCSNHTFKSCTKSAQHSQIQSTQKEGLACVKCAKKPSKSSSGCLNCRLQRNNKPAWETAILPSARRFHSSDSRTRLRPCRDRLTRLKTLFSRLTAVGRSQPKTAASIKRFALRTFEQKIHVRYQSSKQQEGTSHRCQCHGENANFVTCYIFFKSPSSTWVRTTRSPCGAQFVSTKNKARRRILFIREADGHIDIFIRRASGHTNIVCIEELGRPNVFSQSWPEPISELCLHCDTRPDQNHLEYLQYVVELLNRRTPKRKN